MTGSAEEVLQRIQSGSADWGHLLLDALAEGGRELVRRYGLNRSRLFIRPSPNLRYFVLNTERPLFKNTRAI